MIKFIKKFFSVIMNIVLFIFYCISLLWIVKLICDDADRTTKQMFKDILSEEEYVIWEKQYYGLGDAFNDGGSFEKSIKGKS